MYNNFSYINGNYLVSIDKLGTKKYRALRVGEELVSKFPDSIDLKITEKCDIGCPYCHESSTPGGKNFNLENTINLLDKLPKVGIELAIGGGDILNESLSSDLKEFISWTLKNNFFPRLTINIKSVLKKVGNITDYSAFDGRLFSLVNNEDLSDLLLARVTAYGISIEYYDKKLLKNIEEGCREFINSRIVYHVIVGIMSPEDIISMINDGRCVLILGYKFWGRGKTSRLRYSIEETERIIKRNFLNIRTRGFSNKGGVVGFDNLAIEQLHIKDCLTDREWNRLYMGEEFTHTMYVDAVKEEFAPTSRDPKRSSWNDYPEGIVEYFIKNKYDKTFN